MCGSRSLNLGCACGQLFKLSQIWLSAGKSLGTSSCDTKQLPHPGNVLEQQEPLPVPAGARAGFSCSEELQLALESAAQAASEAASNGDETVKQAARNVVACLLHDDAAFMAWQTRHKHQLRGSTRVLQHLLQVRSRGACTASQIWDKHQPCCSTSCGCSVVASAFLHSQTLVVWVMPLPSSTLCCVCPSARQSQPRPLLKHEGSVTRGQAGASPTEVLASNNSLQQGL